MRVPLRTIAALPITNGIGESATPGAPGWPRYIRTTDIASLDALDETRRASLPPRVAAPAMLAAGDILMCAAGSVGVAHQWQGREPACYAGYLVRLRVNEQLADARFVAWWTQSSDFLDQVYAGAVRSTIDNYSAGKYRATTLPLPPLSSQIAIASYLNRETTEIDAFIADQEQLIALLEERRNTIVSATVSRLGSARRKLRSVLRFSNGDRGANYPSRDDFIEEGVPFVNAGHLRGGRIDYSAMNYIATDKYVAMGGAKLRPGDVLYCLRGSLGKSAIFDGAEDGALASSLVSMRARGTAITPEFALLLLNSDLERAQRVVMQTGTAQPNLGAEQLAEMRFPIPPLHEQRGIVARLDTETFSVDAAIADAREAIALSKERRVALISAAVTGRLDVTERKRVLV